MPIVSTGHNHISNAKCNMSHLETLFSWSSLKKQTAHVCNTTCSNSLQRELLPQLYTQQISSNTDPEYQCEKVAHITESSPIYAVCRRVSVTIPRQRTSLGGEFEQISNIAVRDCDIAKETWRYKYQIKHISMRYSWHGCRCLCLFKCVTYDLSKC